MLPRRGASDTGREQFGQLPDGRSIDRFRLAAGGIAIEVMTLGAIIRSLRVPDRSGRMDDVVLGFDTLAEYLDNPDYFGAVVGRYANRIRNGRFSLDGRSCQLSINDGPNHLHGGSRGFDRALWDADWLPDRDGVRLRYVSPNGEQGYPGTLIATVVYRLEPPSSVAIEFEASSDRPTPVNLTQHSYFHPAGSAMGDVLDHRLWINAEVYTPIDAALLPTGEIAPVSGTPLDFRAGERIGARIDADHEQIVNGRGYDHNFVLRGRHAARAADPASGRMMDVFTTEPGLQFYSGNMLTGGRGKGGRPYPRRSGFCLETQHFPDSPNHPQFPSTILWPGSILRSRTTFAFGVETSLVSRG
jgi:aldose 1-epimerase